MRSFIFLGWYHCFLFPRSSSFIRRFFFSSFSFFPFAPRFKRTFCAPFSAPSFVRRTHSFSSKASVPHSTCQPFVCHPFSPPYHGYFASNNTQGIHRHRPDDFYQSWMKSFVIWLSFYDLHHSCGFDVPRISRSPRPYYSSSRLPSWNREPLTFIRLTFLNSREKLSFYVITNNEYDHVHRGKNENTEKNINDFQGNDGNRIKSRRQT